MENKSFTFELTDNDGKHILQSDKDCVWKCKECKNEVDVTKESLMGLRNNISPKCPKCGRDMKFHYWLDCQD